MSGHWQRPNSDMTMIQPWPSNWLTLMTLTLDDLWCPGLWMILTLDDLDSTVTWLWAAIDLDPNWRDLDIETLIQPWSFMALTLGDLVDPNLGWPWPRMALIWDDLDQLRFWPWRNMTKDDLGQGWLWPWMSLSLDDLDHGRLWPLMTWPRMTLAKDYFDLGW
jgi:hypothetical protein